MYRFVRRNSHSCLTYTPIPSTCTIYVKLELSGKTTTTTRKHFVIILCGKRKRFSIYNIFSLCLAFPFFCPSLSLPVFFNHFSSSDKKIFDLKDSHPFCQNPFFRSHPRLPYTTLTQFNVGFNVG